MPICAFKAKNSARAPIINYFLSKMKFDLIALASALGFAVLSAAAPMLDRRAAPNVEFEIDNPSVDIGP